MRQSAAGLNLTDTSKRKNIDCLFPTQSDPCVPSLPTQTQTQGPLLKTHRTVCVTIISISHLFFLVVFMMWLILAFVYFRGKLLPQLEIDCPTAVLLKYSWGFLVFFYLL